MTAFYHLSEFPALERLAENWDVFRREYQSLDVPDLGIARVGLSRVEIGLEVLRLGLGSGWLQGWTHAGRANPDWQSYVLTLHGRAVLDVRHNMPQSVALLLEIPGVKVCALNKLNPHTLISAHTHDELPREGLLQYHLCLTMSETQDFNYLNVNGIFKHQYPGLAYVFDGSLPHFAVNATSEERVILYMEFYVDALRSEPP